MDSRSSSKKESTEVARESLIAISNTSPDKILDSNSVSERKKSDGVLMSKANCDQDDKCRSELISISYAEAESPDVKIGSVSMGV